jgi:hypothetical protein
MDWELITFHWLDREVQKVESPARQYPESIIVNSETVDG